MNPTRSLRLTYASLLYLPTYLAPRPAFPPVLFSALELSPIMVIRSMQKVAATGTELIRLGAPGLAIFPRNNGRLLQR